MQIIYATEKMPDAFSKSLFLAGPSIRSDTPPKYNWRKEALSLLEDMGYDGVVFVPLPKNDDWKNNYDEQIHWEQEAMNHSDIIVFWVPRDMNYLPGLTTNFEFGQRIPFNNVVLGYPKNAEKIKYLHWMADYYNLPEVKHSLKETLSIALQKIGKGFPRDGGECQIPFHIWNTPMFKNWYKFQLLAGNRLDGAKLIFNFMAGPKKDIPVFIGIQPKIWIKKEQRYKDNEIIFMRSNISTIVAFTKKEKIEDYEFLIVREVRQACCNEECIVYENAGGSSLKPGLFPENVASEEFEEETGLKIDSNRFTKLEERQLAATALTHKAHLFVVELTDQEMDLCKKREKDGTTFGIEKDTEKTYLKIMKLNDILNNNLIDWSNLGMIFSAIMRK